MGICRLETWFDAAGGFHVLVTEVASNPGENITDAHAVLRAEIEKWLEIPEGMAYFFWEQYDENSYRPPRDREWIEVSRVDCVPTGFIWRHVPEEEWQEIYHEPRRPKPKTIRRPGK